MVQSTLAPVVRRPRRAALWLPALILVATVGCSHRRASMRPVYIGPATTVPAASAPIETAPSAVESIPLESESASFPSTITSTPASADDTPPPVTAPSVPRLPDEPSFEPNGAGESSKVSPSKSKRPSSSSKTGESTGMGSGTSSPSASVRSTNNRKPPASRLHQASLVDELTSFVNDPDDLFSPPKADRPWKYIVLHHSASSVGSYDSIDQEHRKRLGWAGCGYHFVIGNGSETPDGTIEVSQRWSNQKHGVHCRDGKHPDVNEYGIGICLVGDLEKSPPTPRQIAAARALVAYLRTRYHINGDHVDSHAHLAASPTSCPGRLFPTDSILGAKGLAFHQTDND